MTNLEEKILNGPIAGYCSSSDGEDDDAPVIVPHEPTLPSDARRLIRNTGPKGVIEDWKAFKEEQARARFEQEKQIVAAAKYGLLSGSHNVLDTEDQDLEALRKERMQQLKDAVNAKGKVIELTSKEQFLTAIENSHNKLLLIHIYEHGIAGCESLNEAFCSLAVQFPLARLARIKSSVLETSERFTSFGLPTLQVYYSDTLVGNYVRVCDHLGEDFKAVNLLKFLHDHEINLALGRKEDFYLEGDDDSVEKGLQ